MVELVNKFFWHNPWLYVLIIATILLCLFRKKITGLAGEHWVKQELKKLPKQYKVLNNILIMYNDKTHQIDHIVVSENGLFIIETKQINGYITGNDYDKNWRVKSGRKTYYMYNPIHQNYGHKEHINDTKINKKNNESKLENKCPLCGGELVERKGYSNFIGCSNYPRCNYIK